MIAKCPCEKCGSNIEFDAQNLGEDIVCPHCKSGTRLHGDVVFKNPNPPHPNLVRCPDCRSEVSRHADACPKCGRRIKPTKSIFEVVFIVMISVIALSVIIGFILMILGDVLTGNIKSR